MSSALRVSTVSPSEGFAAVIERDAFDLNLLRKWNRFSLKEHWCPATLSWYWQRKKDKTPSVTTLAAGALCFPRALHGQLFPGSAQDLEFLPACVEDDEWLLLNCLRVTDAVAYASSDLQFSECEGWSPSIFSVRWINITDKRAFVWDVFCIPNSAGQEYPEAPRRWLFVTDRFIERYRQLGLRGLDFKHVGYIVADASQAVPKPPAPPAPPPKPSKRKPVKLTSAPLPADEQIELAEVGAEWRQRFQITADTDREVVLQRITSELQRLRPVFWTISADERIDATLGLSALYGQLLHTHAGWSWAELRESRSKRWFGLVSPSSAHALALAPYIQQQMQSEAPTATLLFNMVMAGNLPPAEPGQLVLIG